VVEKLFKLIPELDPNGGAGVNNYS